MAMLVDCREGKHALRFVQPRPVVSVPVAVFEAAFVTMHVRMSLDTSLVRAVAQFS